MLRAGLPMYLRAETEPALNLFWGIIRDGIIARGAALADDLPEALEAPESLWSLWESPDLILGQSCSLPYRGRLRGKVDYVITLDHALPGCPAGYYNSVVVTRPGGVPEGVLAYNSRNSQSGWAAAREVIEAGRAQASGVLSTGAHIDSARAVAQGRADWACIDAQTWAMLGRWEPVAASLEERFRTAPTPGLPLICAPGQNATEIAGAVEEAVQLLDPPARETLGLQGAVRLGAKVYLDMPIPQAPAA
ncbi:hypothetical protein FHY55_15600 [Oceanicola sp. D3]|uniref:hypothetical protein n=1 Tax=Oceanicola sp. D3 TaxID=2587163 RepID=UPI00111F5E18|nr:hypothetical protein [Oceanicola sp. D3]QDC10574.1 hypothetical protein FHY55_15600 [Oceanicola sp. D3]